MNIQFRTPFCSYLMQYSSFLILALAISACNSNPAKRPSPLRKDSVVLGKNLNFKIEYSSPSVRGRKLFGNGSDYLEQYNQIWRTGANDASFITIDGPLIIDSVLLDSGSYSIFTIPSSREWIVIFNEEWQQWGSYNYKDSLDVLRVKVPVQKLDSSVEQMRFYIENDSLKFAWDKIGWGIKLSILP